MAVVIITGGGGFLGQCLAASLLEIGTLKIDSTASVKIAKIVLADIAFPPSLQPILEASSLLTRLVGDVSSVEFCSTIYRETVGASHVSIFHLGAVMSGDGERDFDLCMRVNLHGFLNMMEGAKKHVFETLGFPPKFLFTSAGATIGSGAPTDYVTKEDVISDSTRATPHTTYGATKACCELLLSDYARRGFVDGRGVRLPTIIVRAGVPNAATTGCFSGVIREPLAGVDVVLPIASNVRHAVTGKRAAIGAMLAVHDAGREVIESVLGFDRTVFLPAVALSLGELEEALMAVVTQDSAGKLGKIRYEVDDFLSEVVAGFPTKIDADRAMKLGVPAAPDAQTLVREYAADFPTAVKDGILLVTSSPPTGNDNKPKSAEKVAVVTGGGSGIGQAVAQRLSKAGWTLVLAGRTIKTLQETKSLLQGHSICVPTDVTNEKQVRALFQTTQSQFGRLDLLFNNAGINSTAASVFNVTTTDFERVLKTNITGPFMCAREAMQIMAKHGGGRIINNGSISAHVPRPGSTCYTTSKHALLGLTKCVALDGRAINVACGQIDFGNVVSEMSRKTNDAATGAPQANGTMMVEPSMTLGDAAETFMAMANLPLEANVLQMTVMATNMPFVGRG